MIKIFFILYFFAANYAFAVIQVSPTSGGFSYSFYANTDTSKYSSNPLTACNNYFTPTYSALSVALGSSYGSNGGYQYNCTIQTSGGGATYNNQWINPVVYSTPVCPTSTPSFIFNPVTNMCERPSPTCSAAGTPQTVLPKYFATYPPPSSLTLCIGGCSYYNEVSVSGNGKSALTVGPSASSVPCGVDTPGLTAAPSSAPVPMTEQYCLSQGKSFVSMSGITQCVGEGTPGATNITKTSNQINSVSGVSGTTSISNTDSIIGDLVTRSTTIINASGVPSTISSTGPLSQFCETNSEAPMCKEKKGTAGGGDTCTVAPFCDGDAILCAQLQQAWTARCESQTTSSIRTLGENVLNGSDPLTGKPDSSNPTVIPIGAMNTSEIFTGSTCPAPVVAHYSLMGRSNSLSFDLTPFCTLGGVIGLLNVLGSLFAAGRIIAGGI